MGALKWLALALMVTAAGTAPAEPIADWHTHVVAAATRFDLPVAWVERVIAAESGGRTMLAGRPIRSRAGAIGLMQLMPATWAATRAVLGLGTDPDDPHDNILAGTFYLRMMYDRFGYPRLFAAYNAGPGRYADFQAGRASLPAETRAYLRAVAGPGVAPMIAASPRRPPPLFAAGTGADRGDDEPGAPPPSLFAIRH